MDDVDPVEQLLRDAMTQFPTEYSGINDYLQIRDAMPEILANIEFPPAAGGGKQDAKYMFPREGQKMDGVKPAGLIALRPGADPSLLLHELTHAAQKSLNQQEKEGRTSKRAKDAINKLGFTGGDFEMGTQLPGGQVGYRTDGVRQQSNKLAPGFRGSGKTPEQRQFMNYRTSMPELAAWAMGNMTLPPGKQSGSPAPLHHDATLATELQIMLDLATRDMKSRKGYK